MLIIQSNISLIRIGEPTRDMVLHVAGGARQGVPVNKMIGFVNSCRSPKLKKKVLNDKNGRVDTALRVSFKNGHQELANDLAKAGEEMSIYSYVLVSRKSAFGLCRKSKFNEALCVMPFRPSSRRTSIFKLQFANVDLEMAEVRNELEMGVSRYLTIRWNKLRWAIKEGLKDVILEGLIRDGKELLWLKHHDTWETLLHEAVKVVRRIVMPLNLLINFMIAYSITDAALLKNKNGDTALHLALQSGHLTSARSLVNVAPGAVYLVNYKGISPLYLAVRAGHHDLVEYMFQTLTQRCGLAYGTKTLLTPKNHATLAHCAIRYRFTGILQTLMELMPELIDETNEDGWTPLSYAAFKGYLNDVTYLLAKFPGSVEKYNTDGSLPIHKAVEGDHVSILRAFLSRFPQTLYRVDGKGQSILHIAVRCESSLVLAYLTEEIQLDDWFLNLRDKDDKTCME